MSELIPGSIILCTVTGDSQEREWTVTWSGEAEDLTPRREDALHFVPVALVTRDGYNGEVAVYRHPLHGWTSLWDASTRSWEAAPGCPEMTDERLNAASA